MLPRAALKAAKYYPAYSEEATMAAHDTSTEISETARVLKEHGVIRDTASVVDQTARNGIETAETVKVISKESRDAAPETSAALQQRLRPQRNALGLQQKRQKKQ
jgi:uncharacterized protein YydD (DUF2326 family)